MDHFADRLIASIQGKGNALCVGLDPRWEFLPIEIRERHGGESLASVARAYEEFCGRVLDLVTPLVGVVKPQSAFFEECGSDGMAVLQRLLKRCRSSGLVTILDGKRNDIASTAEAYANAAFGGIAVDGRRLPVWDADAVTANAYLGRDSIEPFLESARQAQRGVFVLVRTSNRGAGQFQDLECAGRPLYLHVAEAVKSWGAENVGRSGFGDVGAVVGATSPAELARVRETLPSTLFLVPGFGAQGGTASGVAAAFREHGLGAVVSSSRGILFPFDADDPAWERKIEEATRSAIASLARDTSMSRLQQSR